MKRFAPLLLTLFTTLSLSAQKVDLSPESLQSMLCKKWVSSYSLVSGMRLDMQNGAPKMTFEFKKDKTFLITTDQAGESPKNGTWAYDAGKKRVKLTIDGKSGSTIIALTNDELSMAVDTKEATPDDPTTIIVVYKVKN